MQVEIPLELKKSWGEDEYKLLKEITLKLPHVESEDVFILLHDLKLTGGSEIFSYILVDVFNKLDLVKIRLQKSSTYEKLWEENYKERYEFLKKINEEWEPIDSDINEFEKSR